MVQLLDEDIKTREVLTWTGLHLFHFMSSSCSQKTRIVLNLKGLEWESHQLALRDGENFTDWYLGINPRGLVPTLVADGEVHIESNDIITLLEERYPEPKLIPAGAEDRMAELLEHEDDLHLDLRTITFRFTQRRGKQPKSDEAMANYRTGGTGTVLGREDPNKAREIAFWDTANTTGISDDAVRLSASRFREALDGLNDTLNASPYLMGEELSVLDIAWFIYVNRLRSCGYPMEVLHPALTGWFDGLKARPEFAREIAVPPEVQAAIDDHHAEQRREGRTLVDVAGLA